MKANGLFVSLVASCLAFSTHVVFGAEKPMAAPVTLEQIVVGTPAVIEITPTQIQLGSARRRMHLVVTGKYANGEIQDLTRAAQFFTSNEKVVRIENGRAVPVGDGQADVAVRVGSQWATASVAVSGQASRDPVSFHFEALTGLTKQGCNSGACHGSPSGKGGFRLSLAAYDAQLDATTLVREEFGRRTNVSDPAASLLLLKPTMQMPHGGGKKLTVGDPAYEALRGWIAEGRKLDPPDAPHCEKIVVYPPSGRVLKRPAHTQQLLVVGHFSDGSVRDVTDLATFSSSDEAVASVRPDGLVVGHDRGEVAILVRHLEKVESCYLTFVKDIPGYAWRDVPRHNSIDELVDAKLQQLKYVPADLCSDAEFIRRLNLDVLGVLPEADEVEAFLADTSGDKRAKRIDAVLRRPEYARFWALRWGDLLRLNTKAVSADGVYKYYDWLVRAFEQDVPYDRFAADLLLAQGSTFTNPPANFFRTAADTNDCTETTAQVFFGVRIQCAKCHNHPFERWTQDNYYGLGAFFNRVQRKPSDRKDELVVWIARGGEVTQPRTGKQMKPWLPLAGDVADDAADRRGALVKWLTRAENPFFAKVEVNRIWAHLMGRGIVDPVDDFRDSNPPANAPLLEALAGDFVKSGYSRKHVMRTILNSRTYQQSARTNDLNKDDTKYFSHARVRLLGAEQLLDAICHVTGVAETFPGLPAGTRATSLPSPDLANNEFLKVFGQPERQTACACERSSESNLSQALQLFNGPLIHAKLQDKNNRFHKLSAAGKTDKEIVDTLYMAAVCRHATEREIEASLKHIASKDDRGKALEDVCWAILNTNEFLFQH